MLGSSSSLIRGGCPPICAKTAHSRSFWGCLPCAFFGVSHLSGLASAAGLLYDLATNMMTSPAMPLQFRNTQTPSKVIHLRNLPWECSEEELVELCRHFGKVINTKLNVGANRNQAFVEFADLNQAISMVSYYASSSEPAQIRGRTVYLQYSNRQEIVNSKSSGDLASNVLLVSIEGVEAGDVSIDVLHLVFSAFGFVHKIATFEKSAGFQALVQFSDANTASSAKSALDGRSIPRYLLPEHVGLCNLHISFSAHNDLSVKFQSHRSRDYTNPYLPVAPSAINGTGQFVIGPDGKIKEPESNVLLASVENMQYGVTIEVLHTVFSAFGNVQKIAIFEKNGGFQALVQYPDVPTAVVAKEALEGHCIYDGGYCKLHLSYSRHTDLNVKVNNDRSRDYTNPNLGILEIPRILDQQSMDLVNVPMAVGGPPAAPVLPMSQFGSSVTPPQVDAIGISHVESWDYGGTQVMAPQQKVGNLPSASPSAGSAQNPMYSGLPLLSLGSSASGGIFPPQSGPHHTARAGLSVNPPAFLPMAGCAKGQMDATSLPVGVSSFGPQSPAQSVPPFSQHQPQFLPGPGATPAATTHSPASGLTFFM
eukprot:c28548_g1_i1 orf=266-2044(-)